jgi:hypothetical protein
VGDNRWLLIKVGEAYRGRPRFCVDFEVGMGNVSYVNLRGRVRVGMYVAFPFLNFLPGP